ncbi:MAG: FmdB family zinc ribbon protein [Candidatus Nitrosoglobus sp.]|jgi:putative FmdB family regulatory protein
MPIYEYRCEACGHEMELLQKIADEPLLQCPSCGEDQLRKLISAVGFRLKGGGWYETDFKSGNKRNLAASSDIPKEKEDSGKTKDSQEGSATNSKPKDKNTTSVAATTN